MQYKTVSIEHFTCLKHSAGNKLSKNVSSEYTNIISEQAAQGWKLLGIHPIPIRKEVGCFEKIIRLCCLKSTTDPIQIDILIFFRE